MGFLPNLVTALRLLLVVPAAICLWQEAWLFSLFILGIAALSDALDGALARRFGWISRFGTIMDPIADKILLGVAFIVLTTKALFPLWLMLVVVGREMMILTGVLWSQAWLKSFPVNTLTISKVSTSVQVGVVILLLTSLAELPGFVVLADLVMDPWLFILVAVLTVISGLAYVVMGIRNARVQLNIKASG